MTQMPLSYQPFMISRFTLSVARLNPDDQCTAAETRTRCRQKNFLARPERFRAMGERQ